MKNIFLSAFLIITAAVLSLVFCSCGKTPENNTTTSPTTAQQYIGTVPSGVDLFDDETDKADDGQTVAPNEPYDSDVSGNNNGDKTAVSSGNSAVTAAKSTDKASAANQTAKATTSKAASAKATTTKAAVTTSAKTEKANVYDPAMPDIF
ncbi:MAG: hypothetical protein ACI396_07770 [Acutalibacteraceae bacterium]